MKYSKEFERDIRFYLKNRHVFNFDGRLTEHYSRVSMDVYKIPTDKFNNLKDGDNIDKYFFDNIPNESFNERFPLQTTNQSKGLIFCWYFIQKIEPLIQFDINGVDGINAFFNINNGKVLPTKHPRLLYILLKSKGSVNLNIKMWKEDYNNIWACGRLLPHCDVIEIMEQYNCPNWVYKAITGKEYNPIKQDASLTTEHVNYDYVVEIEPELQNQLELGI